LAEPVLFTLFQHGKFMAHDALMSSYSLKAYVLGLFAFMLIKVLAPGYFARQDMKTPVKIGMLAIGAGIVFKLAIVYPLNIYWQIGHVGLALSTAMAAYVNVFLLYRGLRRRGVYMPASNWRVAWVRYAFANGFMVLSLLVGTYYLHDWAVWSVLERIIYLFLLCLAGGSAYLIGLLAAGFRPQDFRAPD
jgi:putative peptidoglycan lipid II flippase